eukprot:15177543-Alexandrium_andersonii.AAC.1
MRSGRQVAAGPPQGRTSHPSASRAARNPLRQPVLGSPCALATGGGAACSPTAGACARRGSGRIGSGTRRL